MEERRPLFLMRRPRHQFLRPPLWNAVALAPLVRALEGFWEVSIRGPQTSELGTWRLEYFQLLKDPTFCKIIFFNFNGLELFLKCCLCLKKFAQENLGIWEVISIHVIFIGLLLIIKVTPAQPRSL